MIIEGVTLWGLYMLMKVMNELMIHLESEDPMTSVWSCGIVE